MIFGWSGAILLTQSAGHGSLGALGAAAKGLGRLGAGPGTGGDGFQGVFERFSMFLHGFRSLFGGPSQDCEGSESSLQLLQNRQRVGEVSDYQPGRETGVSCMWSACSAALGLVECHHWRCVCVTTAKWSQEANSCVVAAQPAEGQDTGGRQWISMDFDRFP